MLRENGRALSVCGSDNGQLCKLHPRRHADPAMQTRQHPPQVRPRRDKQREIVGVVRGIQAPAASHASCTFVSDGTATTRAVASTAGAPAARSPPTSEGGCTPTVSARAVSAGAPAPAVSRGWPTPTFVASACTAGAPDSTPTVPRVWTSDSTFSAETDTPGAPDATAPASGPS